MPEVILPSGMTGNIRKLKVREQNLLADARQNRNGEALHDVLAGIWTETTDPGPYKFKGAPEWRNVLTGDHFTCMLNVMSLTFPGMYEFNVPCQGCQTTIRWEVDPLSLPLKKLSKASASTLQGGNQFTTTVPSTGAKVTFKLLHANSQQRIIKARRNAGDRLVSAMLLMQLVEAEGIAKAKLGTWVDDLDADDAIALQKAFDAAGCGIETSIDILCSECFLEQEVEIPFGRDFFTGKRKPAKKRTTSSAASAT